MTRGGFVHNRLLIEPVESLLRSMGATIQRESPVHFERLDGAIDLVARIGPLTLAVEAELTPDRVHLDLAKAVAIDATHLLIVAPNGSARMAIQRRITRLGYCSRRGPQVLVLTPPQAPQALRSSFSLFFSLIPGGNPRQTTHAATHSKSAELEVPR